MFEQHGGQERLIGKECKPDYQAQGADIKKRLEKTENLKKSIFDFIETCGGHRFSKVSSMAELLGGLEIVINENDVAYKRILKQIEKED